MAHLIYQVERVGPQHQAGSDSLLTAMTFFQLRTTFFDGKIDDSKYLGHLYGLGGFEMERWSLMQQARRRLCANNWKATIPTILLNEHLWPQRRRQMRQPVQRLPPV